VEDFSAWEKFLYEWEVLGLSVDCHVMTFLRDELQSQNILSTADLTMVRDGAWVKVAGLVVCPHRPPTRSGRRVLFVSLEDEFGLVDAVLFEPVYQAYGHWVLTQPLVIVEGTAATAWTRVKCDCTARGTLSSHAPPGHQLLSRACGAGLPARVKPAVEPTFPMQRSLIDRPPPNPIQ
jgi:DNA polymerase III alpha subunit